MKLDALDHPKTLDFASRLNVTRPTAIGHLELLWAFTGKLSTQGNIGKWPDGAIARACDWMGPADVFITALIDSGFLDLHPSFRLTVHDWSDHAPGWVRAKLKKVGLSFIGSDGSSSDGSSDGTGEASSDDTEPDSSSDTRSFSGPLENALKSTSVASSRAPVSKGREGKRREEKPREDPPACAGLDLPSWTRWFDYRKQIGKPVKPVSIPAAQRKLAAFGTSQAEVVEQSIANSWQGLFPPRSPQAINGHGAQPPAKRYRTADELEHEAITRAVQSGQSDAEIAAEYRGTVTLDRIREIRAEVSHAQH